MPWASTAMSNQSTPRRSPAISPRRRSPWWWRPDPRSSLKLHDLPMTLQWPASSPQWRLLYNKLLLLFLHLGRMMRMRQQLTREKLARTTAASWPSVLTESRTSASSIRASPSSTRAWSTGAVARGKPQSSRWVLFKASSLLHPAWNLRSSWTRLAVKLGIANGWLIRKVRVIKFFFITTHN